jgi:hypothetical protein
MLHKHRIVAWLLFVATAVVAMGVTVSLAQDEAEDPGDPGDPQEPQVGVNVLPLVETFDDKLGRIADSVAEFGGLYLEPTNNDIMYVYLTDASSELDAKQAIQTVLGASAFPPGRQIHVLEAQYSMRDLKAWYSLLLPAVWRIPSVVRTDLAEHLNRVKVAVEDPEAISQVRQAAGELGVPDGALVVPVEERAVPMTHKSLRQKTRPIRGGLQTETLEIGGIEEKCTLGFTVLRDGVKGLITNGHCTTSEFNGGLHGDVVYQANVNTNTRVGVETIEPTPFPGPNGNCQVVQQCRYSDSVFVQVDDTVNIDMGSISRPDSQSGTWLISDTTPEFRITAEDDIVLAGQTSLHKVGRTSGWSSGIVDSACSHESPDGLHFFLCQNIVAAGAPQAGDSGSPVFKWPNSLVSDVSLAGILWASSGARFVYSPLGNVFLDLGPFAVWQTCDTGFGC